MTIFKKIIDRQLPAQIVYEDDLCLAFRDIQPTAPTHILLIPKKEIASLNEIEKADQSTLGHLLLMAPKIAAQEGLADKGYRVVVNTGPSAGQTVFHLHLHILGGRPMGALG